MATRRRVPRTIAGCWGVLTAEGPMLNAITDLPALFGTKAEAEKCCTLADMKAVRVTVRYPLLRPSR